MTSKISHPLDFKSHRIRRFIRSECYKHFTRDRQRFVDDYKQGPNNTLVKETKIVTYSPSEEMESYNVSDFNLENLQAIGASLNTSYLTSHDTTNIIDSITNTLDTLDSINITENITDK